MFRGALQPTVDVFGRLRRRSHRRRQVLHEACQIELIGAFVIDDEIRTNRRDFLSDDGLDGRGIQGFTGGIHDLEPDVRPARGCPEIEPVFDRLGERVPPLVGAGDDRGSCEDDADRPLAAREPDRRTAPSEVVGHQALRRRGVRQVAILRALLVVRRIEHEEPAGGVSEEILVAGIAEEGHVPGLEHVLRPEA
jgi:hypothetical protein